MRFESSPRYVTGNFGLGPRRGQSRFRPHPPVCRPNHRSLELAETKRRLQTLSAREREVLGYVVSGRLNKQIAAELGTAEQTIKVHRARIMENMQAGSLAELVLLADRLGIHRTPAP